jgi:hypothetical protein
VIPAFGALEIARFVARDQTRAVSGIHGRSDDVFEIRMHQSLEVLREVLSTAIDTPVSDPGNPTTAPEL